MSRLKAVALVLSGALASMLYCGWLIVGHIESDAGALAEARAFTLEELEQVDFHYFYCIRGGFYGTQRH